MANLAPQREPSHRFQKRAALLGAVAALALGGAAAEYGFAPNHAYAQTAPAANPGPASFADVVARVKPAVVSVKVKMVEKQTADSEDGDDNATPFSPDDPLGRFFRRFQGPNGPLGRNNQQHNTHPHTGEALGSGFIISGDGYVVTNNHVVENATDVTITTDDGKTHAAKIIGTDKKTDLALLKISDGANFPHVDWAGHTPRVGDWVIAVGNPFGLGGTVTAGIVSARGRDIGAGPYDDFLQIDAPVNRGNSGGPTFDEQGQVVGVNTAIYSPSGGSVGIGFAIPADLAKNVIEDLRTKGSVSRGWIGVQIQPVTPDIEDSLGLKDTHGALVADTQANSPAGKAGIHSGDVIVSVNGETVAGPRELARTIAGMGPDKHAQIAYVENGQQKTADVVLGTLPADQVASADKSSSDDDSSSSTQLSAFGLSLAPAKSVPGAGDNGVVVTDIDPDGMAAQKGLRTGDVILDAGGKSVSKPADISSAISSAKKDGRKAVLLRVKNGDTTRFVAIATSAKAG